MTQDEKKKAVAVIGAGNSSTATLPISQRRRPTAGGRHHPDLGVQYTAVESFFGMLKTGLIYHRRYTRENQTVPLQLYRVFYNRRRRRSTLAYRSPAELEAMTKLA